MSSDWYYVVFAILILEMLISVCIIPNSYPNVIFLDWLLFDQLLTECQQPEDTSLKWFIGLFRNRKRHEIERGLSSNGEKKTVESIG